MTSAPGPICIAGMHRSGTSVVARALQTCGLYLGEQRDLMNPAVDNPDGFWEHVKFLELNDCLLTVLGGAWDWPPAAPENWKDPGLLFWRDRAAALAREFAGREPWGWKDPRNCLTLPFWISAFPGLRVVWVVRNPLEVALSLNRRNGSSYALGIALWAVYNQRLLDEVRPDQYIVTHYASYFQDAPAELRRLVDFLDLPASDETIASCPPVEGDLRHSSFTARQLQEAEVSAQVLDLYSTLCVQAGWSDDVVALPEVAAVASESPFDLPSRPPSREPSGGAERGLHGSGNGHMRHPSTDFPGLGSVNRSFIEAELLRAEVARQEDAILALQRSLEERTTWAQRLRDERAALTQQLTEQIAAHNTHVSELQTRLDEQSGQMDTVFSAIDRMGETVADLRPLASRIRAAVQGCTPAGARVLVVSRGDGEMTRFEGRDGQHFPQTPDGDYWGYHPADSQQAIEHLEALRIAGGEYFVLPSTAFWWLDFYCDFRQHLDTTYRRVWDDAHCIIYYLHASSGEEGS
jgi:Sulfotransferase family